MATEHESHHYNYQRLDHYLTKDSSPEELGNALDEIMGDLVNYTGKEEAYREILPSRHTMLRELRDIFWALKKSE